MNLNIYLVLIISYLTGSIPFAYIITRILSGKDVRDYGSGNVGATNASRVLGIKYGLIIGVCDVVKGFLAVAITQLLLPPDSKLIFLAALIAVIGHNWPIFLKFDGGKGVATTFGVLLKLYPLIFIIYALIFLLTVIITRFVSLGSIVSALALPLLIFLFKGEFIPLYFSLSLTLLILIRHLNNIVRLIRGTERRFSWPERGA